MSDNLLQIFCFLVLSIIVSIIFHKIVKIYLIACILSGLSTIIIYQIIGYFIIGYLDPFFQIAFVIGGSIAFVIAVFVGIPIRKKE